MREPIKSGDDCLVISALGRSKSPNVGLRVKVVSFQGEHSQLGKIWRVTNPELKQLTDSGGYQTTGWADCAESWLQKDPPPAPKQTETSKEPEAA